MSDEKPIESKNESADDLTKSKKPGDIQLNEEELKDVSGGGTHIKSGTMTAVKSGADSKPYLKVD